MYYLRQALPEDFEFVFQLNKTNMRPFVEQIRGWDEEVERADMQKIFKPYIDQIIQLSCKDIGIFSIEQRPTELYLHHIELLPEFQGKGIGGALIRNLQVYARTQGLLVTLRVLKINPAKQFYEHLGFYVTHEFEKNGGIKCEMVWTSDSY